MGQRGGYYDTAGALRDMIPNHTLQLVVMTAMEPPISFHSEAVRDEKAKVLHCDSAAEPRRCPDRGSARPVWFRYDR